MKDKDKQQLRALLISEFVVLAEGKTIALGELLASKWRYVIVGNPVKKVFRKIDLLQFFLGSDKKQTRLIDLDCDVPFIVLEEDKIDDLSAEETKGENIAVYVCDDEILGVIDNYCSIKEFYLDWDRKYRQKELKLRFYLDILNAMEDDIFITDEYGFIQYMNPKGEQVCQIKLEDYIGRHVTDLEKDGVVSKSISMEVLTTGKKTEMAVKLSSGRLIMAIAIPICDEDGHLRYVLSTSKDVKEINELLEKLANMVQELDIQKRELEILRERVANRKEYIFESPPMQQVQKIVSKVAPTDVTILIEGDSGTGKEVVADLVYQCSRRSNKPFVKINCGLIPKDLLESELFGYEPGSFTGADKKGKPGKIEIANGGTIFFDEIGEMPLVLQVKLLEFLQDRTITRIGSVEQIPVDVRVIAATNRTLIDMVQEGTFRGDLYYRLNVMPIKLLPLAERRDDILPLASKFLKKYNLQYNVKKTLTDEVRTELYKYSWPGNVRELMHVMERFVITSDADTIDMKIFKEVINPEVGFVGKIICTEIMPLRDAKAELEHILVKSAYEKFGSSYKAAKVLGINQSTVVRILNRNKAANAETHDS